MKYAEPTENSRKSLINFVKNHPHPPNKHVHGSLFPTIKYLEKTEFQIFYWCFLEIW